MRLDTISALGCLFTVSHQHRKKEMQEIQIVLQAPLAARRKKIVSMSSNLKGKAALSAEFESLSYLTICPCLAVFFISAISFFSCVCSAVLSLSSSLIALSSVLLFSRSNSAEGLSRQAFQIKRWQNVVRLPSTVLLLPAGVFFFANRNIAAPTYPSMLFQVSTPQVPLKAFLGNLEAPRSYSRINGFMYVHSMRSKVV